MSVVKRAVTLLLLLAAVSADVVPDPEHCDGLNVTVPKKDLHKIYGDWVLMWSVSANGTGLDLLANLTSSHVELSLLPDNNTIAYNERNMFRDGSCSKYFMNMTMPSESDPDALSVLLGTLDEKGEITNFNDSAKVEFFETCADCLMMSYRDSMGQYLLSYRREGQHHDVEQMKAVEADNHKLADCLGFPHDEAFQYDGVADFCRKKSSEEAAEEH